MCFIFDDEVLKISEKVFIHYHMQYINHHDVRYWFTPQLVMFSNKKKIMTSMKYLLVGPLVYIRKMRSHTSN